MNLSTSVTLMFRETPFLERFAAAREAGFAGVEIQVLEGPVEETARALADVDIAPVLLNLDMGDLMQGGPGLSGVPGRESDFQRAAEQGAAAAEALGVPLVHLGPSRIPEGVSREDCLACYRRNVEFVLKLDLFDSGRAQPLLEPMNNVDLPDALFTDIDEAAAMLENEFQSRLGLQFDVYHVAKNGMDVLEVWQRLQGQARHVQFSDVPDRHEPGTGTVDFAAVFAAIESSIYDGWVGAEYMPANGTENSFGWMSLLP